MKKTLLSLTLLTTALTWNFAEDAPSVQVAPSNQVIYPDASQILNKTDSKAKPLPPVPLASTKPVVAATPVPATTPVPAAPAAAVKSGAAATTAAALAAPAHGWFLRWTVSGDEAGVRLWAAPLGTVLVQPLGADLWEVLLGPLPPDGLKQALSQPNAQLVKR